MANPFVHVELGTTDLDRAKSFYRSLFGWRLNDVEMGGGMTYTMIGVGEGTGGGMMKHPIPGGPSAWLPYVLVDDIRAATDKAKSLGATIMRDVTAVMDEGSLSIIVDPTGAMSVFGSQRRNSNDLICKRGRRDRAGHDQRAKPRPVPEPAGVR